MPNTPYGQVSLTDPMHLPIRTLNGQQNWSYSTLHDEMPALGHQRHNTLWWL